MSGTGKIMMRLFQAATIKRKLMTIILATSASVLLLTVLAFMVNEALTFRRHLHQELTTLAGIIGINTTAPITFGDRNSATKTLEGLGAKPYILAAYIFTPDNEVFAKYLAPGVNPKRLKMRSRDGDVRWDGRTALTRMAEESKSWWKDWDGDLEVVEPIHFDNQLIGTVVIQSDLMELFARLKWFFITVFFILIGVTTAAYGLSSRLQRSISDPILHLAQTMKAVTDEKNYTIRATRESSDEIGRLIDGFNDMLTQIQQRDKNLERYAEELKESNEELRTFTYIASHDLRTPLVNMKGFAGELRYALREINSVINEFLPSLGDNNRTRLLTAFLKDVPEALGFIESSADRMDELINAISKLSRLGRQELKPELIQVQTIVQSVLKDVQLLIEKNGIKVAVGPLPEMVVDRNSLQMIFGSILDNAVKYLRPGVPGEIKITAEADSKGTTFSIRDNGRGIAKDDMPKVFKMFRRMGTQDEPGEGIGLAAVKILVRRLGGRIWCESESGVGSTFSFTIPHDPNHSQAQERRP